ncbi:hypothetical protein NEF87_004763 [Candidatus Lokiarchaeum ossiferum]|uniref:Zinc ribbon domain-containing protein n=1 Tax=Candidatus Lokiarchaeum ossiferum TaxID=2951803 RepID=A0ABY6HY76_9ARCH|nr:hypothetical protein NEF87_004763 [Candidatus Lokiarchaeum sp. B-35]
MTKDEAISKSYSNFFINTLILELIFVSFDIFMSGLIFGHFGMYVGFFLVLLFFSWVAFRSFKKSMKGGIVYGGASAGTAMARLIIYIVFLPAMIISQKRIKALYPETSNQSANIPPQINSVAIGNPTFKTNSIAKPNKTKPVSPKISPKVKSSKKTAYKPAPKTSTNPIFDNTPKTTTNPIFNNPPKPTTNPIFDHTPKPTTNPIFDHTPKPTTNPIFDHAPKPTTNPIFNNTPKTTTNPIFDPISNSQETRIINPVRISKAGLNTAKTSKKCPSCGKNIKNLASIYCDHCGNSIF